MKERIKNFGLKIWDDVENHLARYVAGIVGVILLAVYSLVWKWSSAKHSLTLYGWLWLLLIFAFLASIIHSLICLFRDRGRFKDRKDIQNAIEGWLTGDDRDPFYNKEEYREYAGLEKGLNIKRGSLKKYLPELARKYSYGVETGKKNVQANR